MLSPKYCWCILREVRLLLILKILAVRKRSSEMQRVGAQESVDLYSSLDSDVNWLTGL